MKRTRFTSIAWVGTMLMPVVLAQAPGTRTGGPPTGIESESVNLLTERTPTFVCGGKTQAGTPIGGNGTAGTNGTSGAITIAGIPATATVVRADLIWTVLHGEDAATSALGQTIQFNGTAVTGFNIGRGAEGPCFPQPNSLAWRATVTSLVPSPGNGVYTVSGFPGGVNFTEGVTLQILWSDPNGALIEDNLYHAAPNAKLAVTQTNLFSQTLNFSPVSAAGPVSSKLYTVFGNGQVADENLRFDGSQPGDLNLDNTLNGSTVAKAPGTCASAIAGVQCYWDDDVHDVSAQLASGDTAAAIKSDPALSNTVDCITWPAVALTVSVNEEAVCAAGGAYVDQQCPQGDMWKNHGEYVSCVAHAAERFLAGLPWDGTCPRGEIQSCIVSQRARSGVGKP